MPRDEPTNLSASEEAEIPAVKESLARDTSNRTDTSPTTDGKTDDPTPPSWIPDLNQHLKLGIQKTQDLPEIKSRDGVKIYAQDASFAQLVKQVAERLPGLWQDTGTVIMSEDRYMKIPLADGWHKRNIASKPYQLGEKDKAVVDSIFDGLHQQGRMEWVTEPTPFGSPVFVV